MNIVIQIVNFVLPYLVNFVSKHMEGWLSCFSKYISQKILDRTDVSITLECIDKNNNRIDTPIAIFNSTKYGEIAKIGDSNGIIKLQGIITNSRKTPSFSYGDIREGAGKHIKKLVCRHGFV